MARAAAELAKQSYAYATTIPERAQEMCDHMRPGATLTGMQLDCVAMLRSRMCRENAAELAFQHEWVCAWERATNKDAPHDHALDRGV